MSAEHPFTQQQINNIIKSYVEKKEYRRIYYKNKYHTDEKYQQYVRDYNKIRYEEKAFTKKLSQLGDSYYVCLSNKKATNLHKYFTKVNRYEVFKTRCPDDFMIYDKHIKTDNEVSTTDN